MYNPPADDTGYEWIEIAHNEGGDISADSIQIVVNGISHSISSTGTGFLPPRKASVIVQDKDRFLADYPEYFGPLFLSSFSLDQYGTIRAMSGDIHGDVTTYESDSRSDNTGASLHNMDGLFVAAPATPGALATNPIPHFRAPEQSATLPPLTQKNEVDESCPPTQQIPASTGSGREINTILVWIAAVLTIIAVELCAILYTLYRKWS